MGKYLHRFQVQGSLRPGIIEKYEQELLQQTKVIPWKLFVGAKDLSSTIYHF